MKKYIKTIRYFIEYILVISLTNIIRLMSIDRASNICSFVARKLGSYFKVTNVARNNLHKIYGDTIDIEKTIDELWDNYGRFIGELPFMNLEDMEKRVKLTGLENIEKFKKENRPFILFSCHQANWDVFLRKLNEIYPKFGIVYRKANNPYVDKYILDQRRYNKDVIMISKGSSGAKDLSRAIKTGSAIAMLLDQKMNDGIEVPFFGKPAMTAPAAAKISLKYNYPLVPLQFIRLGSSSYFEIKLHPPLKVNNTGDRTKDCYDIMLKINKKLEEFIRQKPSQWFWFHNRWK